MPTERYQNSSLGVTVFKEDCEVKLIEGLMNIIKRDGTEVKFEGTRQCYKGESIYWKDCTFEVKTK